MTYLIYEGKEVLNMKNRFIINHKTLLLKM
nr:MAG TPA_asm: hypothetical protein [Caudoviricetes sp.]